jgi:hypothetical protein
MDFSVKLNLGPLMLPPDHVGLRLHSFCKILSSARGASKRDRAKLHDTAFNSYHALLSEQPNGTVLQRRLLRTCQTGCWLTALPSILTRTNLSAQEWSDALYLHYGLTPPNIPSLCDGCHKQNSLTHALNCLNGGLITLRHNEIRQELGAIACEVFPPSAVSVEPLLTSILTPNATLPQAIPIHSDNNTEPSTHPANPTTDTSTTPQAVPIPSDNNTDPTSPPENPTPDTLCTPQDPPQAPPTDPIPDSTLTLPQPNDTAYRGDLAIRNLYERGTTAIIDVRITNLDSQSNCTRDPLRVLKSQEAAKRTKYQATCTSRRESFHPFVASADGMLAPEATKILQHLAHHIAEKQQRPYCTMMKHLRLRISITLVRAVHHCIRASRAKRLRVPPRYIAPEPSDPCPEFRMLFG